MQFTLLLTIGLVVMTHPRVPAQSVGDDHSRHRRAAVDRRHVRVMTVLGYSLDNLSLMALSIAVGFVVDDAIVMVENIVHHLEQGHDAAARRR